MKEPHEPVSGQQLPLEVLYELALSIGNSLDLKENLEQSLAAYLRKLNCCGGAIFSEHSLPDPEVAIPRPRVIASHEGYRAALAHPGWFADRDPAIPCQGQAPGGFHYHWFPLPRFGWLLLLRSPEALTEDLQKALQEINEKLARSARGCRENAANLWESRQLLLNVLDTIPVRVFWKDQHLRYSGCNTAFAKDAGCATPRDLVGRQDSSLAWSGQAEQYRRDDEAVLTYGIPRLRYEEEQQRPDGTTGWLRTSKIPLRDEEGEIIGLLGVYEDITREKRTRERLQNQLREREILLAEVHHRVFNSLSVIASLLRLQAQEEADPAQAFATMQLRIETMAMVYQHLYCMDDHAALDMDVYLREASEKIRIAHPQGGKVRFCLEVAPLAMGLDQAVPCALILNELLSNALIHGYSQGKPGQVLISLAVTGQDLVLRVENDGEPLPETFSLEESCKLGLTLVRILADQLEGELLPLEESPPVAFSVRFPLRDVARYNDG
ncbi:PAS domain S-box-containing protein [Alkalispirochaeta americana]|uniref:histidine kinase n=1 Tax=Alkalispirochaeta americana TaxID=159291 RepID=A0A1N6S1G4_9SPIO|nr:histidine kinase dimerization/phosphoacceptor domain -containing protein [Alkalispirochaeta americana]SIQ34832.1 PAS domain S-box-containing protein [Alkalispirochaeta americana]